MMKRRIEIKEHPRFASWVPGTPSTRLFVKNLATKANEMELAHIFGRFSRTGTGDDVSVRLMTRGKMHGQAFITFPDVEMAQQALDQAIGFLLHDRPMIIVRPIGTFASHNYEFPLSSVPIPRLDKFVV